MCVENEDRCPKSPTGWSEFEPIVREFEKLLVLPGVRNAVCQHAEATRELRNRASSRFKQECRYKQVCEVAEDDHERLAMDAVALLIVHDELRPFARLHDSFRDPFLRGMFDGFEFTTRWCRAALSRVRRGLIESAVVSKKAVDNSQTDRLPKTQKALVALLKKSVVDEDQIIRAYRQTQNYRKAAELLKQEGREMSYSTVRRHCIDAEKRSPGSVFGSVDDRRVEDQDLPTGMSVSRRSVSHRETTIRKTHPNSGQ